MLYHKKGSYILHMLYKNCLLKAIKFIVREFASAWKSISYSTLLWSHLILHCSLSTH